MSQPSNPDNGAILYSPLPLPIAELPTLEPGGTFEAGDMYSVTFTGGQSDGSIVSVVVTQGTELRIGKP